MRLKESFFYTIREDIKDEESTSGNLLVRSGMVKKTSNGIYMYMPLGFRVLKKIEKIIRHEMDETGAQELLMPSLIAEEYYVDSGRRDNFGANMFSLKDRYNRDYVLGPTHEELFVYAAKEKIQSYKDMPFNIYQIGNKYRDETRPRFGLIRVREFLMKDAYSFDISLEKSGDSYQKMFDAYKRIFDTISLDYKIVTADTGAMGGLLSEEFQAVTSIGEDVLVLCDTCEYASNLEVSKAVTKSVSVKDDMKDMERIYTPNTGTIEEVSALLKEDASKFVKTLLYKADDKFVACMVLGNREVNEVKVSKLLGVTDLVLADAFDVTRITNAQVGFAGPISLSVPIIMDEEISQVRNFIVGANETDYHYKNVNVTDFKAAYTADIKNVKEGDICPVCGGHFIFKKGIEVGNTFKLGTKYSESLGLLYADEMNQLKPVFMGCYGIGLGRIMAAVAEQKADEYGICWPANIAPFEVCIVLISDKDEKQVEVANMLYEQCKKNGIDVLIDDRNERAGVKFNDMDLIGIPVRITVGKKVNDGMVELKYRHESEMNVIKIEEVISVLAKEK